MHFIWTLLMLRPFTGLAADFIIPEFASKDWNKHKRMKSFSTKKRDRRNVEHSLATYAQPRCKAKRKSSMRTAVAVLNPVLSTKIGVNMERIPHLAACFQVKKVQTQMSKYGMCSLCTLLHKLTFIHPWPCVYANYAIYIQVLLIS